MRAYFLFLLMHLCLLIPLYAADSPVVTSVAEHNAAYEKGISLIRAYIKVSESEPKLADRQRAELVDGIGYLKAVTNYNPKNWGAFFFLGKAYQAIEDHKSANHSFESAYLIQSMNPDVLREYALSFVELGDGLRAIDITKNAIQLSPNDAGLQANLALAYLIANKNQDALRAVNKALEMKPGDQVSCAVKKLVDDVLVGKKPQPKSGADF